MRLLEAFLTASLGTMLPQNAGGDASTALCVVRKRVRGFYEVWQSPMVRSEIDDLRISIFMSASLLALPFLGFMAAWMLQRTLAQPDISNISCCLFWAGLTVGAVVCTSRERNRRQLLALYVFQQTMIAVRVVCGLWTDPADLAYRLEMFAGMGMAVSMLDVRCAVPPLTLLHAVQIWTCQRLGQPGITDSLFQLVMSVMLCFSMEQMACSAVSAELAARKLLAGFRGVLGASLDGDVILDQHFCILEASPAAGRLMNPQGCLEGMCFLEMMSPADRDKFSALTSHPLVSPKPGDGQEVGKLPQVPRCIRVSLRRGDGTVLGADLFHMRLPATAGSRNCHLVALREDPESVPIPECERPSAAAGPFNSYQSGNAEASSIASESQSWSASVNALSAIGGAPTQALPPPDWSNLVEAKYMLDAGTEMFDIMEVRLRFAGGTPSHPLPHLQRSVHPADWRKTRSRLIDCVWSSFDQNRDLAATHSLGSLHLQLPTYPGFVRARRADLGVVSGPVIDPTSGDDLPRPIYLGLRLTNFVTESQSQTSFTSTSHSLPADSLRRQRSLETELLRQPI